MLAVMKDSKEIVTLSINKGADLNIANMFGDTALTISKKREK
jgi:ankyrin repeat protein